MAIETPPDTSAADAARFDLLDGFGARDQLLDDLASAVEPGGTPQVLALLDLGGLRTYAEDYGRIEGEALLARIAEHCSEALVADARCYRPRHDEFAVLVAVHDSEPFGVIDAVVDAANAVLAEFGITLTHGSVIVPGEANDPFSALALADTRLHLRASGRLSRERRVKPRW